LKVRRGFSYQKMLAITPISLPNKILQSPDSNFLRPAQDGGITSIRVSQPCPLLYIAKQRPLRAFFGSIALEFGYIIKLISTARIL
jgi:hypothetical protein